MERIGGFCFGTLLTRKYIKISSQHLTQLQRHCSWQPALLICGFLRKGRIFKSCLGFGQLVDHFVNGYN